MEFRSIVGVLVPFTQLVCAVDRPQLPTHGKYAETARKAMIGPKLCKKLH